MLVGCRRFHSPHAGNLRCSTFVAVGGALFEAGPVSEAYERYLVPPIFKPWANALLDFTNVGKGEAVLDVASGTGVVAALAADRVRDGGRVVATDVSPVMLALAGAAHPMIETVETAAEELTVDDSSFDVALCQQGFQFLTDQKAPAQAMKRTLRRSGRVAIAVRMSGPLLETVRCIWACVGGPWVAGAVSARIRLRLLDVARRGERCLGCRWIYRRRRRDQGDGSVLADAR